MRKKVIEINRMYNEAVGQAEQRGYATQAVRSKAALLHDKLTALNYKGYQPGEQVTLVAAWKFLLNVSYQSKWAEARHHGKTTKEEYQAARSSFLTTFAKATPELLRENDHGVASSGHPTATWNTAVKFMEAARSVGNKEGWLLGGKALVWLVESGAYYGWE